MTPRFLLMDEVVSRQGDAAPWIEQFGRKAWDIFGKCWFSPWKCSFSPNILYLVLGLRRLTQKYVSKLIVSCITNNLWKLGWSRMFTWTCNVLDWVACETRTAVRSWPCSQCYAFCGFSGWHAWSAPFALWTSSAPRLRDGTLLKCFFWTSHLSKSYQKQPWRDIWGFTEKMAKQLQPKAQPIWPP